MFGNIPRAPSFIYPHDPYDASYWSKYGGLNQITEKGLIGSYKLGQSIKNYYNEFLSPIFNFSKVYARSPDIDSSIMATNTFLAGMFPPSSSNFIWSPSVSWYPIPVHTSHPSQDYIFFQNCERLIDLKLKKLQSKEFKQVEERNHNFTKLMSELSGIVNLSYIDMNKIFESNLAKLDNNLPLQEWVSDYFFNLSIANEYRLKIEQESIEQAKLTSGGLMDSIKNEMINKLNGFSLNEITVYSCLDSHLIGMSRLLNMESNLTQPNYLSSLIFELRKNANGSSFVQIKRRNSSYTEPLRLIPVQIDGCDILCPWDKFLSLINDKTVKNLPEVCDKRTSMSSINSFKHDYDLSAIGSLTFNRKLTLFDLVLIIAVSVLAIVTLILSTLLSLTCTQVRKRMLTRV